MPRALKVLLYLLLAIIMVVLLGVLWVRYQFATLEADSDALPTHFSALPLTPAFAPGEREPCAESYPLKHAWFGDLHVHTAVSYDSAAFGNIATPDDAYRFAQGGKLTLRLRSDGRKPEDQIPTVQLARPLDFAAVTDHAENMAAVKICLTPGAEGYGSLPCGLYRGDIRLPVEDTLQPLIRLASFAILGTQRAARVCGSDGARCLAATKDSGLEAQRAAEEAYDRSADCSFSSFVAYEYSLAKEASNLHRNVIFANATVPPVPLSAQDTEQPEKLWGWLKSQCVDSGTGCNVLAIPHNSNWSNGRMFFPYSFSQRPEPEQRALARLRSELEPLAEVMQVKGDSECRNGLSGVLGGADEYCDFEKLRHPEDTAEDCADGFGSGGMRLTGCHSRYSFARYALIEGLREEERLGANSFRLGLIAATDNHTAAAGAVEEAAYPGSTGMDRTPRSRIRAPVEVPGGIAKGDVTRYNPGGLAGIWAPENTRESLFAAMQRRETFGTSGPRILPRFFAGWDFPADVCSSNDMLATAYAHGVPMGGELGATPASDAAPQFIVSAMRDSAPDSTPLQKIQIIKGWVDEQGNMQQRVFDVAGNSEPLASVNPATCEQSGEGFSNLCAVWRDAEFDPSVSAVYYSRVIENPSCRWSRYDCNAIAPEVRPEQCTDGSMEDVIQERAWTSPIWYSAR